jgi:glycosyltransferase involved in cell wall biosynthesis
VGADRTGSGLNPRILFLHSSAGLYGADLQLLALASGLRRRGCETAAVLPERGELAARLEATGVEVAVHPLAVLRRRLTTPAGLATLARDARREGDALAGFARGAALVHSNTSVILGGGRAARAAGVPHVVHVREIYEGAGGKLGALAWPLMRRRIQAADARICVSGAVARQFEAGATHVVHDGLTRLPGASAAADARSALGIAADAFVIAVLGRVADWKGQDVLARALALPALADIGAVGLVAGDAYPGEEDRAPALDRLRDELGLGDRLRLLGFHDNPGEVIAAADVMAVASTRPDPFPNSALDALAAGRPVVASNAGGLPELVRDGETGVLVPSGDHVALANALRSLAEDPARRELMGAAAATDAAARFSAEAMLDGVEAVYAELGVTR